METYGLRKDLEVNEFDFKLSTSYGLKLAVVADLHEREFEDIVERLKIIQPSVILLLGDTLERRDEGYIGYTKQDIDSWQKVSPLWKVCCRFLRIFGLDKKNDYYAKSNNGIMFIKAISKIAPVIMSVGNHEWYFTEDDYKLFEECGVMLLDNYDREFSFNGQKILFGGLSTRYDLEWLKIFSEKSQDKILLCHHPEYIDRYSPNAQLIISGHAHGGQIRICKQGLFAPGQGLFPKFTKGLYKNHLISAGVSNTAFFPRINNPREICVIKI